MQDRFHLKGLNGLRAIAALAVVVSHTLLAGPSFGLPARQKGLDLAGFGVTIFFALSGFLITYLLLLEKEKFATINIKAFYIRRILRIWPLYYFYLIVCVFVMVYFHLADLPGPLGFYIFLSANIPFITGTALPLIGHYWSLGVEEQFYLFWPWVVGKSSRIIRVLLIFIGVFILLKIGFAALYRYTGIIWPYTIMSVCRFECMAIGALGAVFSFTGDIRFRKIVFHPVSEIIAWLVIVLLFLESFHISSAIDNDIIAAISVVLIMNVSFNNKKIVGLDNAVFNFLGKISYGIYVYHPLVIFFAIRMFKKLSIGLTDFQTYVTVISFILLLTISVAWTSYEFFEKKFLRRKEKYAAIPSSSVRVNV
jgi:peptidoglycan/LPS O-acetylase OafA/YrhL